MKAQVKLLILALSVTSILSSCNNLDETVFSSVTQQSYNYTVKDFPQIVAAPYSYLRSLGTMDGPYWLNEGASDELMAPANASGWGAHNMQVNLQTWDATFGHIGNSWNMFYQGILFCNNAIQQVESGQVPAPSDAEKTAALAELRALRAYYYWMVCDHFGDAPIILKPTQDLPDRKPRKEVYELAVSELLAAIPSLSEEQGGNMYGRINKWAAKTILANLYLNAEVYTGEAHWNDCLTQCNDIINSGKCELSANYNASFRQTGVETSKEILWTVPFDADLAGGFTIHMCSLHGALQRKYEMQDSPWGAGSIMGNPQFVNTYQPNDSRLQDSWVMGPQFAADGVTPLLGSYDKAGQQLNFVNAVPDAYYTAEDAGYRVGKFEVAKGERANWNTDLPLFRYAQVLMMKAECLLRTNQAGAGALVTEVRRRAFKDHPDEAVVTDEQLKGNTSYQYGYVENFQIVDPGNQDPVTFGRMLDELGWEFVWEQFRRRDLIRFGIYTKKSWCSHKPMGEHLKLFPIPQFVLNANPNLTQNPGYDEIK